jgi:hypothetical protein
MSQSSKLLSVVLLLSAAVFTSIWAQVCIDLAAAGIRTIELDYKFSKKMDEHGNQFRYRAKVKDSKGEQVGRWAWDVFLVTAQ